MKIEIEVNCCEECPWVYYTEMPGYVFCDHDDDAGFRILDDQIIDPCCPLNQPTNNACDVEAK